MSESDKTLDEQTLFHAKRWRLILGKYADKDLDQAGFNQDDFRLERTLDYLYSREYSRRGMKTEDRQQDSSRSGGSEDSAYTAINWLNQTRKLFPQSTFERMQTQAIERYQIDGILKDPAALRSLEPTQNIACLLMNMRGRLSSELYDAVRELIAKVVEDILRKIRPRFINAITGRRNRFRRSPIANSQNFDWRATISANLKHFDPERKKLLIETPIFNSRSQRQFPWDIILCVDQSASMDSSIMYAAVCTSILASLPSVNVHLVVFDTQVVDLTHMAHDPVEVLMTVQLGGGTDIAKAMQYCEQKIKNPSRTILALISDFCEGGSLSQLLATVSRLNEGQVKLLGLAALNEAAQPEYDIQIGQKLANRGMHVAALTPEHFADWIAEVMQ